jgi:hypothetical protein
MDRQTLMGRLDSDGATGLDLSPGDPVASAAAKYIRDLEAALREIADMGYHPVDGHIRVAKAALATGGIADG